MTNFGPLLLVALLFGGCYRAAGSHEVVSDAGGTGTDTGEATGMDADTDADADAGGDTDADTDADTDTDTGTEAGEDGGPDTDPPGLSWRLMDAPSHRYLDIQGSGPGSVYALAANAIEDRIVLSFEGEGWTEFCLMNERYFDHLWTAAPGDILAGGFTWDENGLPRAAVSHCDDEGVGALHQFLVDYDPFNQLVGSWITGLVGTSSQDVLALVKGTYTSSLGPIPSTETHSMSGFQHFDGISWNDSQHALFDGLVAAWGTSIDDFHAAAHSYADSENSSRIYRCDGKDCSPAMEMEPGIIATAVFGFSTNDVFAVGQDYESSTVFRCDGDVWTEVKTLEKVILNDIWGSSGTDVFFVGRRSDPPTGAVVVHFDGTDWKEMYFNEEIAYLSAIWGRSSTDVFAAGDGCILHYCSPEKMTLGS